MELNRVLTHLDAVEIIVNERIIPFLANVPKALVTLTILVLKALIKVARQASIFATEYRTKPANVPVENQISEDTQDTETVEDTKVESEIIIADSYDALNDAALATDGILSIIESINLVTPIVKTNSIECFVTTGLADELSRNYLESVSYTLPRNRRTKKGYTRHDKIGILNEHFPIVVKSGILA